MHNADTTESKHRLQRVCQHLFQSLDVRESEREREREREREKEKEHQIMDYLKTRREKTDGHYPIFT